LVRCGSNRHPRRHAVVDLDTRLENVLRTRFVVSLAADRSGVHPFTVNRDHELVWNLVSFDADVTLSDSPKEPAGEHILGIGRKIATNQRTAPRTTGQSF